MVRKNWMMSCVSAIVVAAAAYAAPPAVKNGYAPVNGLSIYY